MSKSQDSYPLQISPENSRVAEKFLANACDVHKTARELGLTSHEVANIIDEKTTSNYLRTLLLNSSIGRMGELEEFMQEIIENKMQELREMELTSSKDIVEIITAFNKMLESKAKLLGNEAKPVQQNNKQINIYGDAPGYSRLMESLANNVTSK